MQDQQFHTRLYKKNLQKSWFLLSLVQATQVICEEARATKADNGSNGHSILVVSLLSVGLCALGK